VISPGALSMSPGDGGSVSASEIGYQGTFTESDNCAGILSVSNLDKSHFAVTAVAPGMCSISISDTNGHSGKVSVSVQSIVIGGQ
jgi:hypothetical protein